MTPAPTSRRGTDRASRQRTHATVRPTVPAPAVRPARPVTLQLSRGQVPATPAAACASHDPDLWFSSSPAGIAQATAICQGCPDRLPCLSGATRRREAHGIWGGTDFTAGDHREHVA